MPYLDWISDTDLKNAVNYLLVRAKTAQKNAEANFGKNVIDPFSAIFVMSGFGLDFKTWMNTETTRQSQKTLQNHIGEFHQNILGSVSGWQNMKTGNVIDLVSSGRKIVAEVKNKYNTISGGKLADLYNSLDGLVMPKTSIYKGYVAYYVAIIPKGRKRYDRVFTPSNKEIGERCSSNEYIREIDGSSFYDLVTGKEKALVGLYNVLPVVIEECSGVSSKSEDIDRLKAFFNLAFA